MVNKPLEASSGISGSTRFYLLEICHPVSENAQGFVLQQGDCGVDQGPLVASSSEEPQRR